jgi:Tol biopolymer transport system component
MSGVTTHVGAPWSADGSTIVYRSPEGGAWGIWRTSADGSKPAKLANDAPPVEGAYDRVAVSK